MASQSRKTDEVRVSLLPSEATAGHTPRQRAMFVLIVALVGLAAALGFGTVYLRSDIARTHARVLQAQTALEAEEAELEATQSRIGRVENLGQIAGLAKTMLNEHTAAGRAVEILESAAISEVAIRDFSMDMKGTAIVAVHALNYAAVVRQLVAWHANAAIEDTRIANVSARVDKVGTIEGVDFSATIILKPEALIWAPRQ